MRIKLKEKKQGLYLLLVAILAIITLVKIIVFNSVYQSDASRVYDFDSSRYELPALALLNTGSLALEPHAIHSKALNAAPFYSVFIATVYKLFGENRYAVIIAQILVSTLTIFFVYLIAAKLWGQSTGVIAALLMALEPLQFVYSQVMLSEVLSTAITTLFIVFFAYMMLSKKYMYTFAFLMGLALAAATMTRPVNYFLIFPVVMGIIWFRKSINLQGVSLPRLLLLIIVPYMLIIGSWHVRNGLLTGAYEFSDNGSTLVLRYKAAAVLVYQQGITDDEAYTQIKKDMPRYYSFAEKLALEKQTAYDIVWENKLDYFLLSLKNLPHILLGPGFDLFGKHFDGDALGRYQSVKGEVAITFTDKVGLLTGYQLWYISVMSYVIGFMLLMYLFALYGLFSIKGSKQKVWVIHALMFGFVLFFIGISTGNSFAYSRLRMPIMPIFVLYASYTFHVLLLRYNVLERVGIYLTPEPLNSETFTDEVVVARKDNPHS